MDFKNIGAKRVCVVTDKTVRNLDAMRQVQEGLDREGVEYCIFDGVRVEPKDTSYVTIHIGHVAMFLTGWIGLRRLSLLLAHMRRMPFWRLVVDR